MTDNEFTLTFKIVNTDMTNERAEKWLADLVSAMPEGTVASLEKAARVVNVDELTVEHEGYQIVINRTAPQSAIRGRLSKVYPIDGKEFGRILVIDGRAVEAKPYEVVTIN